MSVPNLISAFNPLAAGVLVSAFAADFAADFFVSVFAGSDFDDVDFFACVEVEPVFLVVELLVGVCARPAITPRATAKANNRLDFMNPPIFYCAAFKANEASPPRRANKASSSSVKGDPTRRQPMSAPNTRLCQASG